MLFPRQFFAAPFLMLCGVAGGLGIALASLPKAPAPDRCALPHGVDFGALGERDRSYAMRRALLCADLETRRIGPSEYRDALKALDVQPQVVQVTAAREPEMLWADEVRAVSTQYSDSSWSAGRALGPPDVYPAGGDNANAWASRDADAPIEFLELGYDQPRRVNAVELYETYNPGAVTNVEVITASGERRSVYQASAKPMGRPSYRRHIEFACTAEPIVAVRVTMNSKAVAGWNEIDAVGLSPCDSQ